MGYTMNDWECINGAKDELSVEIRRLAKGREQTQIKLSIGSQGQVRK
jgi:hypothetical protein